MPRAAIFGRIAKVTKISGACGMRGCYGRVGLHVRFCSGIVAEFVYSYFILFHDEKVSKKSSRNEAAARPARIARSLGMLLTTASLGS
jgi:hypothetical protein